MRMIEPDLYVLMQLEILWQNNNSQMWYDDKYFTGEILQ